MPVAYLVRSRSSGGPGSLIPRASIVKKAGGREWTSSVRTRSERSWSPAGCPDCYLGLLLPPGPAGEPEAGTVLLVAPAVLLHPRVPQPAGSLVYALLTGHPKRDAGELVFVAGLACELRAWPQGTWTKVDVDPDQVAQAMIGCWRDGEATGLQLDDLSFEEAHSLTRPAMIHVCGQLRGRQPGDQFP
jgi:hypothetical protein